jgi:D-allose transport system substrate-binding protein
MLSLVVETSRETVIYCTSGRDAVGCVMADIWNFYRCSRVEAASRLPEMRWNAMKNRPWFMLLVACWGWWLPSGDVAAAPASDPQATPLVLFINPGWAQESFWGDVDRLMTAAAPSLGLRLEVFHADRDPVRMVQYLAERLKRKPLPDYVILVNQRQMGLGLLRLLVHYPIPVQFILSDLEPGQQTQIQSDPHWQRYLLPAIVPDYPWVGRQTMRNLLQQGAVTPSRPAQVLMISGDKVTPASLLRDEAALGELQGHASAVLLQQVFGQWEEKTAYNQMRVLLHRHPEVTHIWTGSDQMAFGALRALKELGRKPGQDVWLSTLDTSPSILTLLAHGEVSVLGGGHFIAGAQALLTIHDLHAGLAPAKGRHFKLFTLITPHSALFTRLLDPQWQTVSFIQFSRTQSQPRSVEELLE